MQAVSSSIPPRRFQPVLALTNVPDPSTAPDAPLVLPYFKTMAEIEALPRYQKDINPKTTKIARLVGLYSGFRIPVRCGLSRCHRSHMTGVVIETMDGDVTNIGHICGGHYFEEYQKIKNRYDMNAARSRRLRALREVLESERILRARIANIKAQPLGADWLHTAYKNFFTQVPSEVINVLRERAQRGDARVTEVERVHGEEAERIRQFQGGLSRARGKDEPVYRERELGHLCGLAIWRGRTIRDVLDEGVLARLGQLEAQDLPSLRLNVLKDWANLADSLPPRLR